MKDRRSRALRTALGWLLLEVAAAAQVLNEDGTTLLQSWCRTAVSPVVWTATRLSDFSEDLVVGLRASRSVMAEFQELRTDLEATKARKILLEQDVETLSEARTMLASIPRLGGQSVLARCTFRQLSLGRMQVRLGDDRQPPLGAAAISGDGLVGRVVRDDVDGSWIQLITHTASAVAVHTEDRRVHGLAVGTGGGRLAIEYVPKSAALLRGGLLFSSGADGVYPAGIPVAKVNSLRETDAAFLEVGAVPCVNLGEINVVLLLPRWSVGSGPS